MATAKITKDELSSILKKFLLCDDMDMVRGAVDDLADEYRIDLTEPDPLDEIVDDRDAYLEEDEVEDLFKSGSTGWDDDDNDF